MTASVRRRIAVVPLVMTTAMLATFVGLGFWQLQRKAEKVALNGALALRAEQAPEALAPRRQWPALRPATDEFRRVTVEAQFLPVEPALVFTAGSPLRPDVSGTGYWAFAPARLASGELIVVNRGFIPEGRQAGSLAPTADGSATRLVAVVRFPEMRGWLTPQDQPTARRWYARDPLGMAQAYAWGPVAPFYLDLESPVPEGGMPKPGRLQLHVRDDHLQYALTWFGLALAVLVAFGVWWRGQRPKPGGTV